MKSALALALLLAAGTAAADIKVLVAVDPSDRESMAIGVLDIGASLSRAAGVPARMSKSQDLSDAMRSTRTGEFDVYIAPAHVAASALSHGEQRQLEIAMVLATEPEVLLLDEPLAGMGAEESRRMVGLLRRLAADHAILLVEHDMDAVFALADVITVMVNGQVLESGPPAQIRASEQVQRAYLGHGEDGGG